MIRPSKASSSPVKIGDQPVRGHALILNHLEEVLDSRAFRGSRRCQEFMRFIVGYALEEHPEPLKERTIGVGILGRDANYDTGQDSIVRVKANEVRKRLAQYYGDEGKDSRVRILLPPGSYQPVFICDADEHGELVSTPARTRRRLLLAGAVLASIAAVAGALWALRSRESALETFWEPILKSRSRVLLCLPHPIVYHVIGPQAPELLRSFSENRSLEDRSIRANPALNAAIVPRPRQYVGVGAARVLRSHAGPG